MFDSTPVLDLDLDILTIKTWSGILMKPVRKTLKSLIRSRCCKIEM